MSAATTWSILVFLILLAAAVVLTARAVHRADVELDRLRRAEAARDAIGRAATRSTEEASPCRG